VAHFFDANILLSSISRNPADSLKGSSSFPLLADGLGVLSVQVMQEFFVQAARSSRPDAISHGADPINSRQ
jgi:hypothetical protein